MLKCDTGKQRVQNIGLWFQMSPWEYVDGLLDGLVVLHQAHAARVADQHYNLQLKKKVWSGWQSLIQKHWKVKVERACRARAEEVCAQLSTQYEAKLEEVNRPEHRLSKNSIAVYSAL